ncbi:hypothetical protein [Halovibrio variabilis]|uniref:hypothetical protein n=1 Tax=Halovibrio variabilis TaxID=31910 RepID=UPI0014784E53|nr:hypothetical protein [Halovibrio variabilis]
MRFIKLPKLSQFRLTEHGFGTQMAAALPTASMLELASQLAAQGEAGGESTGHYASTQR